MQQQEITELLCYASEKGASDIHITVDSAPVLRINGHLHSLQMKRLTVEDTENFIKSIMNSKQEEEFKARGEFDFSYSLPGIGRFRINVFRQRGAVGMAIRLIPFSIPTPEKLNLPASCLDFAKLDKGLVLVTGPTGSGKSTTLASIIDLININYAKHIVTIEDPIEYLHKHQKSLVNQREIGMDTSSFATALRSVLRQDPDVILVGEMRDLETIATAITAAETGHLVFSTLHTSDSTQAIDRIIDVFPPFQQQQIRVQLAAVLQGIIAQKLIPKANEEGRIAAYEILKVNTAVRNLIREGKSHQIPTVIQTGVKLGMQTMEKSIQDLIMQGIIIGNRD